MMSIQEQIDALIPPGDPHSEARKEFCKAAVQAIAQVCLEHSDGDFENAMKGLQSCFVEGVMAFQRAGIMNS